MVGDAVVQGIKRRKRGKHGSVACAEESHALGVSEEDDRRRSVSTVKSFAAAL